MSKLDALKDVAHVVWGAIRKKRSIQIWTAVSIPLLLGWFLLCISKERSKTSDLLYTMIASACVPQALMRFGEFCAKRAKRKEDEEDPGIIKMIDEKGRIKLQELMNGILSSIRGKYLEASVDVDNELVSYTHGFNGALARCERDVIHKFSLSSIEVDLSPMATTHFKIEKALNEKQREVKIKKDVEVAVLREDFTKQLESL